MMTRLWILLLPFFILSCAVSDREKSGPVFCTINQSELYNIGVNPGADFDETNLEKTTSFTSNDCPNVNNAPFTVLIDRVARDNTTLTVIEDQFKANQFLLELQVSGNDILPHRNQLNINNCSIIQTWRGTIDVPGNTLTINEQIIYKGACQSTFYNPEFDTTNPGQNI